MRSKTVIPSLVISLSLTLIMVVSCGGADSDAGGSQKAAGASTASETAAQSEGSDQSTEVVAYYFHTTYRCASCRKIEAYSREAIESGFAEELKQGALKFKSVNIDESENKHFVKDYQLYTKSLVVCDMENGNEVEWKNLTKVWQLIRNKEQFVKYVQDEINAYLKES